MQMYGVVNIKYKLEDPMEAFSSHPGHGNAEETVNGFPGINHNRASAAYENYSGGVSAPVLNSEVTTDVNVEVRSIVPDNDRDDNHSTFTQNAQAND